MAERFGSQTHPSGGQRFGSQTYAAINASAGSLAAVESGADTFAGSSIPGLHGALSVQESGIDIAAVSGTSSLLFTLQARETGSDGFSASGRVANQSLRFGSQVHPGGGVRFGSQLWAALGPSGPLTATESGSDSVAAVGWLETSGYTFALYDIGPVFVDYSTESVASEITGTLDAGYKVLLPVQSLGGVSITWELNAFLNPSLRIANVSGVREAFNIPWYVWTGSAWTAAQFDISDSIQGLVSLVETGNDQIIFNGGQTGTLAATESADDFVGISGGVLISGGLIVNESATADIFSAAGATSFTGAMAAIESITNDSMTASGGVAASGIVAALELASDSLLASGRIVSTGTLAAVESGADQFSASVLLIASGPLAATESGADSLAVAGAVLVSGSSAISESALDQFSCSVSTARAGDVIAREAVADIASASGAVAISGSMSAVDSSDVFASTGQRETQGEFVAAEFDAIEGRVDRFVGRGIDGDLPPVNDFDGPITLLSQTTRYVVRSKKKAAAA